MNNFLYRRLQLGGDLQAISCLNSVQIQQNLLLSNFVSEATQWQNLSAMAVGGLAYRLGKVGVLGASASFPTLARVLAPSLALLSEITAFRGVSHGLAHISGYELEEDFLNAKGFGRDLVNFASLKIVGHAMRATNPLLAHASQTSAMVAGHQLAYGLGCATQPKDSLLDQIVHAEAVNLQMSFGSKLTYLVSGGRLDLQERKLELEIQSREFSLKSNKSVLKGAYTSPPLSVFSSTKSDSQRELWPQSLESSQREFVRRMQAEQAAKRQLGLMDYYREVSGNEEVTLESFETAFRTWLGEGRPELAIKKADHSVRAKYLFIKQMESAQREVEISSLLLEGVPDALKNSIPVHVEIHRSRKGLASPHQRPSPDGLDSQGVSPKGVIFLLAGYGETVAMQEEHITHFVENGYVVVAADQRGHGFSGHPLGFEGYMSSPGEALGDMQLVLRSIQKNPELNTLPLFGFGFSQGALLHTLLAQYDSEAYAGFSFISPTHKLGRRFEFVKPEALAASGKTLGDYTRLGMDFKTQENPGGNLIKQNFLKFVESPARHVAQKWLDRGFAPPYFMMNDSSVFWQKLIQWSTQMAEDSIFLDVPTYIMVGSKDDNIGGTQVLERSRLLFDNPIERIYFAKDHQLLLEEEGLPQEILRFSVEFFDRALEQRQRPVSPPSRFQEIIFHPNGLAGRARALAETVDPAQDEIHLRYVGEQFPSKEDFNLLHDEIKRCFPDDSSLWLSLSTFGLHVYFDKKAGGVHSKLRGFVVQDAAKIESEFLRLLSIERSYFEAYSPTFEIKYSGFDSLNEATAVAALTEVLDKQLIADTQSLVIIGEYSGLKVSVTREKDKLKVEVSKGQAVPQHYYLVPNAITGKLEKRVNLEGRAYSYRSYEAYQGALLEFSKANLGEGEVDLILKSLEHIQQHNPEEYGSVLRAYLLEKLTLRAIDYAYYSGHTASMRELSRFIEEAYTHFDFRTLLYLKGRLGVEKIDRYDEVVANINRESLKVGEHLMTFAEMPLDSPMAALLPHEDALRDFFLRHGIFSEPRRVLENRLLLKDFSLMAKAMFVPTFRNVISYVLPNVEDAVESNVFTQDSSKLSSNELELKEDTEMCLKRFGELVRILRKNGDDSHRSFLKEVLPLIQGSYQKAVSAVSKLPLHVLREYALDGLESLEALQKSLNLTPNDKQP